MEREPLSRVDTAWLRMERPTNPMMITGVICLDRNATYDNLLHSVERRFLAFRRFRQKAVRTPSGAHWEADEDFDIQHHVRRAALPGKADRQELEEYVSDLASTALDAARPLWQFHFIENLAGGPAVVMRIHHCYADGMALVRVFLALTDASPEPAPGADREASRRAHAGEPGLVQRFLEPAREGVDFALQMYHRVLDEATRIAHEPERAGAWIDGASEVAKELAYLLSLPDDPATPFRGRLGARKQVAWTDPLPLDEIKCLAEMLGCTVNDVLVAAVSGALRHYLLQRGWSPAEGSAIRATVPVNLRPPGQGSELGNRFGLVFLPLPIGISNPLQRVHLARQRMSELKASRQASASFGLLAVLGAGPAALQDAALDILSGKASTVLTNVPGPREELLLAGGSVREMMFWVPQSGSVGLGVSVLSYAGKVCFGVMADRRLVPDPQGIARRIQPELELLFKLAMMMPPEDWPLAGAAEAFLQEAVQRLERAAPG